MPTKLDPVHFILSHLIWIVALVVGLIGIHSYLSEHDQRLLAAQQAKISEQKVKDLQAQIATSDAQAAQTIAALKKAATRVTTPQQAIAAIPDVSNLHPTISVTDPTKVEVPAVEFYQELNQCKQDNIALGACQVARAAKDEQLAAKDAEIAAYKKPKSFWHRTTTTLKYIGIGIAIGAVLAGGHL
jgi:hypothetical protein